MKVGLPAWLRRVHHEMIVPRRLAIGEHPFVRAMQSGAAEPRDAERFFSGLMWHLMDFGKHVDHLMKKRPAAAGALLAGRSEDQDGDTEILGRIVDAFSGPVTQIRTRYWTYRPHPVWIAHDGLLRSCVYSTDLPWQVGAAGLNVGIESLVPSMIQPLFEAAVRNYNITAEQAAWLESRSGEAEIQHGDNGYLLLAHFVDEGDQELQASCTFYIDALSRSMAYGLLESGLR